MRAGRSDAEFSHSLTDLMSGVAVMFLVLAAIFMLQASQARRRAQQESARSMQLAEENQVNARRFEALDTRNQQGILEIQRMRDALGGVRSVELLYDVAKDPQLLTIVFKPEILQFGSGRCDLPSKLSQLLRQTLREIFPSICAAVATGLEKSIALEGHTDNQPPMGVTCPAVRTARACYRHREDARCLKESLEGNVQLSSARAHHVFFEAREVLRDQPALAQCLDHNFVVAGRGPMEPLDGGSWELARSPKENERNRRVVIKVRVRVPFEPRAGAQGGAP